MVLTDGEFISLSKHQVSRGEVTMDDMLLLVNVTESQHQLCYGGKMANSHVCYVFRSHFGSILVSCPV